ncbi:hypothetical protein ACLBX9_14360 [Methylobacterium sp. A49B]
MTATRWRKRDCASSPQGASRTALYTPWTVEAGPLTSTLRLRRAALLDGFAGTVAALRGESEPPLT